MISKINVYMGSACCWPSLNPVALNIAAALKIIIDDEKKPISSILSS